MKKLFKSFVAFSLTILVAFGLTACKKPVSATTTNDEKTIVNQTKTNGGITTVYDGYLYFINGTKTNNGTSSRNTVQGSICKIQYDTEKCEVKEGATAEVVVSDLVGFEDGSIHIFGDYLYYATPCDDVNYEGSKLNSKTEFKRYDLKNKSTSLIYRTDKNNANETVSYAYYKVAEDLYLAVYEDVSKTLTSIKVGESSSVVYKIQNVEKCLFSDNYGDSEKIDTVDANNFIFYSVAPTIAEDGYDEGAKIFKVSPNKNNSTWLGHTDSKGNIHNIVTLLSITNGKLVYTDESITGDTYIYAQSINSASMLEFNDADIISYKAYSGEKDLILIYMSNSQMAMVAYNASSKNIVYIEKESGKTIPSTHTIVNFSDEKTINFVGMVTVTEKDDETTNVVEYLLYTETSSSSSSSKTTLNKLEVKRNNVIATTPIIEEVISGDNSVSIDGLIIPEVIGNKLYAMVTDKDKNVYMNVVDLSKKVGDDNKLIFVGKK